ncbi:10669_t:CDS:2 [Acaulospora colombiana]|uniref:10669_t:CDS:1 n=1 Tax=Acaulospora colombiana TaxID=27376 RepID=A0ACA9M3Z8_9GLOM|nr:10669_t:CDS:2 [Acaulospora colombiana]
MGQRRKDSSEYDNIRMSYPCKLTGCKVSTEQVAHLGWWYKLRRPKMAKSKTQPRPLHRPTHKASAKVLPSSMTSHKLFPSNITLNITVCVLWMLPLTLHTPAVAHFGPIRLLPHPKQAKDKQATEESAIEQLPQEHEDPTIPGTSLSFHFTHQIALESRLLPVNCLTLTFHVIVVTTGPPPLGHSQSGRQNIPGIDHCAYSICVVYEMLKDSGVSLALRSVSANSYNKWQLYTIVCILDIEPKNEFGIKINPSASLDQLRTEIIEERSRLLNGIKPADLTLHRVDIQGAKKIEELKGTLIELKDKEPLRPILSVIEVYPSPPPVDTVHVAVLLSSHKSYPEALLPIPFSPEQSDGIKGLKKFESNLRRTFQDFFNYDVQLPLWAPDSGPNSVHIANLNIPAISHDPSLLLHNLGRPSHDVKLVDRVNRLDSFVIRQGQARPVYFLKAFGVMGQFRRLKTITSENEDTALTENRETAARRFLLILYVRMFVFRVFLECAADTPSGITEDHKARWLLIQVAPKTLLKMPEVFLKMIHLAGRASYDYLRAAIASEHIDVHHLLAERKPVDLFCVLDEAQALTHEFLDCFLSDTEPQHPRPILHEIIIDWEMVFPNLIFSGTGVSMRDVETDLSCAVAKEGPPLRSTITEVAGFDDKVDQRAYLEQYFLPGLWDTPVGQEIAARIGYWLHGRFVCATSL